MTRRQVLLCVALLVSAGALPVFSQSPVQLALFNPVQIVPETRSVSGVRLSIYGKNASVTGVDLGFVNFSTSGTSQGIQFSLIGFNEGSFTGVQLDGVGVTKGNLEGAQIGLYNSGGHVRGVQLGFVNNAATMKGVQIGVINIIQKGAGLSPVLPIINWSF